MDSRQGGGPDGMKRTMTRAKGRPCEGEEALEREADGATGSEKRSDRNAAQGGWTGGLGWE